MFKYTNKTTNYYQFLFFISFFVFLFQSFVFLFYEPEILFKDDEFFLFVSFKLALNTFTILCPCVLTIANSLLNLKVGYEMFKQEILVKDMGFLNNSIRKCFIDKTGTLTEKFVSTEEDYFIRGKRLTIFHRRRVGLRLWNIDITVIYRVYIIIIFIFTIIFIIGLF